MTQEERRRRLTEELLSERAAYADIAIPEDEESQKKLLRSLFNLRMPGAASTAFLKLQDEYLKEEIRQKGITRLDDLSPVRENLYLWQGDITTLASDAIVNAANSAMLGCFYPCHGCIDNAIHTFAGIQLRLQCEKIMQAQGHEERTGEAKITPAYNLPSRYVLHTVGPIVRGRVTEREGRQLASCYRSCLSLSEERGISSIAFPCISTGEFRFPNREAAKIATETVAEYRLRTHSRMKVIFNVFKNEDYDIYRELLG